MRRLLKEAMDQAGSGWIFRFWGGKAEKNLTRIAESLAEFAQTYQRQFGERRRRHSAATARPICSQVGATSDTVARRMSRL